MWLLDQFRPDDPEFIRGLDPQRGVVAPRVNHGDFNVRADQH